MLEVRLKGVREPVAAWRDFTLEDDAQPGAAKKGEEKKVFMHSN